MNPTPSPLEDRWSEHLNTWSSSGLTQVAYCREHGLRPNQFTYWKRKLTAPDADEMPTPCTNTPSFVPLTVNSSHSGLCLRLPNGCELSSIETQHLPIVTQLLEVLI